MDARSRAEQGREDLLTRGQGDRERERRKGPCVVHAGQAQQEREGSHRSRDHSQGEGIACDQGPGRWRQQVQSQDGDR